MTELWINSFVSTTCMYYLIHIYHTLLCIIYYLYVSCIILTHNENTIKRRPLRDIPPSPNVLENIFNSRWRFSLFSHGEDILHLQCSCWIFTILQRKFFEVKEKSCSYKSSSRHIYFRHTYIYIVALHTLFDIEMQCAFLSLRTFSLFG